MAFKLGDMVEWSSQSGGFWTTKRGEVLAVVAPNAAPKQRLKKGSGLRRDHESYIVRTYEIGRRRTGAFMEQPKFKKESRMYWPRVRALKSVES